MNAPAPAPSWNPLLELISGREEILKATAAAENEAAATERRLSVLRERCVALTQNVRALDSAIAALRERFPEWAPQEQPAAEAA